MKKVIKVIFNNNDSIESNFERNPKANEKEDKSSVYSVPSKAYGLVYIGETDRLLCSCLQKQNLL